MIQVSNQSQRLQGWLQQSLKFSLIGVAVSLLSACQDSESMPAIGDCDAGAITPIAAIQGTGATSPLLGDEVTIAAIVSKNLSREDQHQAVYVQSLATAVDNDPNTSEGLVVKVSEAYPELVAGDVVIARGEIQEIQEVTSLVLAQPLQVCAAQEAPVPTPLTLPVANVGEFEAYEGMLVSFKQPLVVNGHYQLQRFGEFDVAAERLYTPTQLTHERAEIALLLNLYARQRLVIDDNSQLQNPAAIPFPAPQLTADMPLRSGHEIINLQGVLLERDGNYRIQPQLPLTILHANPRPNMPPAPAAEAIRVASFNVLNYFNGNGQGGDFPTPRGAETLAEFKRQEAKIIAAIAALQAHIVGIMEIENDGYGEAAAIQTLTQALRAQTGADWRFITAPNGQRLGTDQITNGILYRADIVTPQGAAQVLRDGPFQWGSRPVLAQAFNRLNTSATQPLWVAVNHFKSKGSCPKDAADPNANQADGQACWNQLRTESALALSDWLTTLTANAANSAQVVLGDFNAYAQEDPMRTLAQAGYINLAEKFEPKGYSYVYDAQAGSLDHVLVNQALADKVQQLAHWHINADEPRALEYGTAYKSELQQQQWYAADPYRASDHDPVYIDIRW